MLNSPSQSRQRNIRKMNGRSVGPHPSQDFTNMVTPFFSSLLRIGLLGPFLLFSFFSPLSENVPSPPPFFQLLITFFWHKNRVPHFFLSFEESRWVRLLFPFFLLYRQVPHFFFLFILNYGTPPFRPPSSTLNILALS